MVREKPEKRQGEESSRYIVKNSYEASYRRNYDRYYGRNKKTHRYAKEEEPIPYGTAFRLRVILCAALFLLFVFSKDSIFSEKDVDAVCQALSEPASVERTMEDIKDCITLIQNQE